MISCAFAIRSSVVSPCADKTTTTLFPALYVSAMMLATFRIRSVFATELPPNFCTTSPIFFVYPLHTAKRHVLCFFYFMTLLGKCPLRLPAGHCKFNPIRESGFARPAPPPWSPPQPAPSAGRETRFRPPAHHFDGAFGFLQRPVLPAP